MSTTLAPVQRAQIAPLEFTPEQRKMILTSFLNGASEAEASVLLELARIRRLNPILRQIHFVKRPKWNADTRQYEDVWSAQVGIDGFRAIAERTGLYDGQDEPAFEYEGKSSLPKVCRVKVYRKDWTRPVVGVAHLSEYAQKKKDGTFTQMWAEKPHIMLAKCAEALALRKAFPEDFSGLYVPEEMGEAPPEKELNAGPATPVVVEAKPPESKALPPQSQTAPATGSRTAQIKSQLAARQARLVIVDVKPGETEQQAVARCQQEPAPHPWQNIKKLLADAGLEQGRWESIVLGATGKTTRKALTDDDIARVEGALVALRTEPPAGEDIPV